MHLLSTWHKGTVRWVSIGRDTSTATITEEVQDNEGAAQHGDASALSSV